VTGSNSGLNFVIKRMPDHRASPVEKKTHLGFGFFPPHSLLLSEAANDGGRERS